MNRTRRRSVRDGLHDVLAEAEDGGEEHEHDGGVPVVQLVRKVVHAHPGARQHPRQLHHQVRVQHLLCSLDLRSARTERPAVKMGHVGLMLVGRMPFDSLMHKPMAQ